MLCRKSKMLLTDRSLSEHYIFHGTYIESQEMRSLFITNYHLVKWEVRCTVRSQDLTSFNFRRFLKMFQPRRKIWRKKYFQGNFCGVKILLLFVLKNILRFGASLWTLVKLFFEIVFCIVYCYFLLIANYCNNRNPCKIMPEDKRWKFLKMIFVSAVFLTTNNKTQSPWFEYIFNKSRMHNFYIWVLN